MTLKPVPISLFSLLFLGLYFYKKNPTPTHKPHTHQRDFLKIASLNLTADEITVDILRESNALHELLALSTLADDPKYSFISQKIAQQVPYRSNSSLEKLIDLKPDLVFTASFNRLSLVQTLKQSGIKVINLSNFSSLKDLYNNYNLIGNALNKNKISQNLIEKMKQKIIEIQTKYFVTKQSKKTLLWLTDDTTIGGKTLIDDVISLCGGENILKQKNLTGWIKPSREKLASYQADWLITSCNKEEKEKTRENLRNHSILRNLSAVKKGQIIYLSPREFSTQSSHITETIDHVCRRFYETTKKTS